MVSSRLLSTRQSTRHARHKPWSEHLPRLFGSRAPVRAPVTPVKSCVCAGQSTRQSTRQPSIALVPQPSVSPRRYGGGLGLRLPRGSARRSPFRVDRPRIVIDVTQVRDASRSEKDFTEARRLYEVEGWSLREIAGAIDVGHETVRRHVIAEGWERDDASVIARDTKRRAFAQAAVTANVSKWAERRSSEADEAGGTAKLARERAVLALIEGDPQMAKAAAIVYGITIDKAQLLSGGATAREVPYEDLVTQADKIWDELAARRAS